MSESPSADIRGFSQLYRKCRLHWPIVLTAVFGVAMVVMLNAALHADNSTTGRWQKTAAAAGGQARLCPTPEKVVKQATASTAPQAARPLQALPPPEFYINALNVEPVRRKDSFDPQINVTELTIMLNLAWAFLDLCEQHKMQVILYGGTLLGSYRHHGIMPWDDDVDFMMKEADQDKLLSVVKQSHPDLVVTQAGRWKVWNRTACLHRAYSWCWPYLDLSFYAIRGGHLYDTVTAYGYNYSYPAEVAFPLHRRPFMGRWVDAPRDSLRFLGFDKSPTANCISLYYSHKLEDAPVSEVQTLNCASLTDTYPFVIRVPDTIDDGTDSNGRRGNGRHRLLETLRFRGGRPAYTVAVEEPPDAFNYEFSIVPVE